MTSKINLKTLFTMPMAPPPNKLSLHAKQFDGKTKERQCCARFYGGYCSLWPNRTARSLSMAWPSLLRAHNHIGGATAVPLHHKKCLLCSVLIYIVLDETASGACDALSILFYIACAFHALTLHTYTVVGGKGCYIGPVAILNHRPF